MNKFVDYMANLFLALFYGLGYVMGTILCAFGFKAIKAREYARKRGWIE